MNKHRKGPITPPNQRQATKPAISAPPSVSSLLDSMRDGNEYGSIVGLRPDPNLDINVELLRAVRAIEDVRGRPCLCYVGNVVTGDGLSGVDASDDLPFAEMVAAVPAEAREVDVLLATRGGSGHQIGRFVNVLRSRFDGVDVLLPSFCMSAGTLFALSADRIWMTPMACLGPIDPQVPLRDGRFVPAQALLLLVDNLQKQGDEAMKKSQPIPWSAVRMIDSLDKKELGDAISASDYSRKMAAEFLVQYKFRNWTVRGSSGLEVTPEYREDRAQEIASALASHDRWKNHGHSIGREVLWEEIRLQIDHPSAELERELRRAWALFSWVFASTTTAKIVLSTNYRYFRHRNQPKGV